MFCIVIEIELPNRHIVKLLVSYWRYDYGNVQVFLLLPSKKNTNPQNRLFGTEKICRALCGRVEVLIVLSEDVHAEYFSKDSIKQGFEYFNRLKYGKLG